MKSRVYLYLPVISLLLLSSSYSQQKVVSNSTISQFSPSLTVTSLAGSGVTIVSGTSYDLNPALLGMYVGDVQYSVNSYLGEISLYPTEIKNNKLYNTGVVVGFKKNSENGTDFRTFGLAYQFHRYTFEFDNHINRAYKITEATHEITLSAGWHKKYYFSIGGTIRSNQASYLSTKFNQQYDLGLAISREVILKNKPVPEGWKKQDEDHWHIIPTLGFSILNIGSDLETNSAEVIETVNQTFLGVSLKLKRVKNRLTLHSLMPFFEIEKNLEKDQKYIVHFGGELEFFELLRVRYGRKDKEFNSLTAWGFSFHTYGIRSIINKNYVKEEPERTQNIFDRLNLIFSFASNIQFESNSDLDEKFYNVSLVLNH